MKAPEYMPGFSPLPDYACLIASGEDATSFLQGQLSSDLLSPAARLGQLSSLSTAKGRVIAMPRLKRDESDIHLVLPAGLAARVRDHLRRFTLRARVEISLAPQARIFGLSADQETLAMVAQKMLLISLPGPSGLAMAVDFEDSSEPPAALRGWHHSARDEWEWTEIRAGLPEVTDATSERFVAQMINLDLLDGISFSKGCYVGQEIIARAQHLGRIKRRMGLFRCAQAVASPGDPVFDGDRQGRYRRPRGYCGCGTVLVAGQRAPRCVGARSRRRRRAA